MFEPQFCVVSEEALAACEPENKYHHDASQAADEHSNKRQLEGGEDFAPRKAARSSESLERRGVIEDLNIVFMVQIEESDNQHQAEGLISLPAVPQTNDQLGEHQEAYNLTNVNVLPDHEEKETEEGMRVLSIAQTHQPNNRQKEEGLLARTITPTYQSDDQLPEDDLTQLISPVLGRDLSISCLLRCSRSDYGTIAMLNKSFHSLVQEGVLYKLRRKIGVVEHWVYFSCNLLQWEAFDPTRGRWMHLPRMTSNACFMCSDKESLAVGTELLVFGKEISSHIIYKYCLLTNEWTTGMEMNIPRCLFASASLGEIAILAGGCDERARVLDSAELYNSEKGAWEVIPSMNKARKMCSGVFMDGKFYAIGGNGKDNKMHTCGEVYDLKTKTWEVIPNMYPVQTGGAARGTGEAPPLLAVVKDELYAADYADHVVRKYNKVKNEWTTLGGLPRRASSVNGWGLAFRACGDRLMVIGGPRTFGEGLLEVNSWIPNDSAPEWELLARRSTGSFVYNCTVMGC